MVWVGVGVDESGCVIVSCSGEREAIYRGGLESFCRLLGTEELWGGSGVPLTHSMVFLASKE